MICIARWVGFIGLLGLTLAGCKTEDPAPLQAGTFDPNIVSQQKSLCEERGGRWGAGGKAANLVCYMTPEDANTFCSVDTDCEGFCLARSRSCAPVTPMFGCNDVLNARGAMQTVCID